MFIRAHGIWYNKRELMEKLNKKYRKGNFNLIEENTPNDFRSVYVPIWLNGYINTKKQIVVIDSCGQRREIYYKVKPRDKGGCPLYATM